MAANGRGLYQFSENGDSLGTLNSGLTNLNVHTLALDSHGYVYAGTDSGVYRRPWGQLLTLKRVPQEYTTIQAAINASSDGDTVLVSDGTYYENIRFTGKRILVASTYVTTNDTSHIANTIIDGSAPTHPDSGSVVYFINGEDTTSVLCGFTITGGTGTRDSVFGTPVRAGGGIFTNSGARISHNRIIGNSVVSSSRAAWGGGIEALLDGLDYIIVDDNLIAFNIDSSSSSNSNGASGGGIDINGVDAVGGTVRIVGNTIMANRSISMTDNMNAWAGGISLYLVTAFISDNVLAENITRSPNCTIYPSWGGGVMTYSVKLDFINNRVTDNIVETPGGGRGGGISITTESTAGLRDALLSGNYVAFNTAAGGVARGGGVFVLDMRPRMENNVITGNSAVYGGAVGMSRTNTLDGGSETVSPRFKGWHATQLDQQSSLILPAPVLVNNTIARNTATGGLGGGVWSYGFWTPVVLNTVLWGDTGTQEIYISSGSINVQYCDVQGGFAGAGNINEDPDFEAGGFNLGPTSPCIGAGRDTITTLPVTDYYGNPRPRPVGSNPDIGAIESPRSGPASEIRCVPQDFPTIQAAIEAAVAGDTVLVDHGIYFENILINKDSILIGSRLIIDADTSHIAVTIINGSTPRHADSGATVSFGTLADTTSVITGFTITGGTGNRDTYAPYPWPGTIRQGGGVLIEQRGTVRQNHITGNTIAPVNDDVGAYGAGIGVSSFANSFAIIEDNIVSGNFITLTTGDRDVAGAGIILAGNGRVLRNVIAEDTIVCTGGTGGAAGLYVGDCTSALVADNLIAHNHFKITGYATATPTGGGISTRRGSVCIIGNRIHGNNITSAGGYAARGGGIDILNDPDTVLVMVSGNRIDSNTVTSNDSRGGGIRIYNTRVRIENNVIDHNDARYGGGMYVGTVSDLRRTQIVNNTITGNVGTVGGGIYASAATPVVLNTILYGDSARVNNREIYGTPIIRYSNIQGGYTGTGNIDAAPQLAGDEFMLSGLSPCLGTGIDSLQVDGVWYMAPEFCMHGGVRPSPAGSMPDMGACENTRLPVVVQIAEAWNLVSVPLVAADYLLASFFPTSTGQAFFYTPGSGYEGTDTLANRVGYWLKFPADVNVPMLGTPIDFDTVDVQPGWNLIGSISLSIDVASIGSIPGGIVTSQFVGYTPGGYGTVGTLEPGKGYWVKVSQPGRLILGSGASSAGLIKIIPSNDTPPPPPGEEPGGRTREIPGEYVLEQNYPNPFNPVTTIAFAIPAGTNRRASLQVFDMLGRCVATLVDGPIEPGYYSVTFDASSLASGVYLYRLMAGGFTATKRMLVVK